MLLFWICSYGGPWLGDSCKGLWFRSSPSEVPDSGPDLQRFLLPAYSLRGLKLTSGPAEVLTQVYSLESLIFMPGLQWSLTLAHLLSSCSLVSASMFAVSRLIQPRSLAQSCFLKYPWSGSAPVPAEFTVQGPLWPRSLAQPYSCGVCCLRPALSQVAGLVLLL